MEPEKQKKEGQTKNDLKNSNEASFKAYKLSDVMCQKTLENTFIGQGNTLLSKNS